MMPIEPTSGAGGPSPNSGTEPVVITASTDPTAKAKSSKPPSTPSGHTKSDNFRPMVFLYRMLLGIFVVEAIFLGAAYKGCIEMTQGTRNIQEVCPRLAERSDNLFGVAIATVLSLMTGQAVENFKNKS